MKGTNMDNTPTHKDHTATLKFGLMHCTCGSELMWQPTLNGEPSTRVVCLATLHAMPALTTTT